MDRQQETLLRAFRISLDDLSVNRLGRLSVAQQRKLISDARWNLVLIFFCSCLVTASLYIGYETISDLLGWIVRILLSVFILMPGIIISIRHIRQTFLAVTNGHVERLPGQIESLNSGDGGGWYFTSAGQFFRLPLFHPWQNHHDGMYRGYIVPGIRSIVAIETLYEVPLGNSNTG